MNVITRFSLNRQWRMATGILLSVQILSCPMAAWAAANGEPVQPRVTDQGMPAAVTTPLNVTVNRTPPLNEPPAAELSFGATPSDAELFRVHFFAEPLVPVGRATTPADNEALGAALREYAKNHEDYAPLKTYLALHPKSPWAPVLHLNLGIWYAKASFYKRAFNSLIAAWDLTKAETEGAGKLLGDRAVGELSELYGTLGCAEALAPLLAEVDQRVFSGSATQQVVRARELLAFMYYHADHAYNCGPLALDTFARLGRPKVDHIDMLFDPEEGVVGRNLTEMEKLSWTAGMNLVMVKRAGNEHFPVPSIIHWKTQHFDILSERDGNRYRLRNPYSNEESWVSQAALDEETTGYVLVPVNKVPTGWTRVSEEEAKTVWGGCHTGTLDKNNTHRCEKGSGGCGGGTTPMASYSIQMALANLHITDTPISYQPVKGEAIRFEMNYNHREANQPQSFNYSNLGRLWAFDWLSFTTDGGGAMDSNGYQPAETVNLYERGGGTTPFAFYTGSTAIVSPRDHSTLTRVSVPATEVYYISANTARIQPGPIMRYQRSFSDGSVWIYDRVSSGGWGGSGGRQIFLTKMTDPQGNSVTISYDSSNRITGITDALGQVTILEYGSGGYNITRVTDPFGRFATFTYDGTGNLTSITDPVGIVSQFVYNGDFIQQLITPYGKTTFGAGESGSDSSNRRWVEATDPMGGMERVEYDQGETGLIPDSDPAFPAGTNVLASGFYFQNELLDTRNTFYWDKKTMMTSRGDYTKAHIYHWLHDQTVDQITDVLESEKAPLESRVWYNYEGQVAPFYSTGTSQSPIRSGRILNGTNLQLVQATYNALGNVATTTDPMGRKMSYTYAANGIDITAVRNMTAGGAGDLLVSYTYTDGTHPTSIHKPLTVTDAAGQVTTFTYNAAGQMTTRTVVRNGINETTTWNYDVSGYLQNITGPVAGATMAFQYDGYKRIWKVTDSEGYTRAGDYDAIDRVTKVTYPDGSYEQANYNKLDAEWLRDRLGRWTHLFHDPLRRVSAAVDPAGRMTKYDWCVCGALHGLTDGEGHTTRFAYDIQRRLIQKTYDDTTAVQFAYDSYRNLMSARTDAKGQVTHYAYDIDDSLNTTSYTDALNVPLASTPTVTLGNGANYRRVESITTGGDTTIYEYYPTTAGQLGAGKLKSVNGPLTGDVDKVSYSYDELGRVIATNVDGAVEQITLDALGRTTKVVNDLAPAGTSFDYTYLNQTKRLASVSYPNGLSTIYSYWPNIAEAPAGSGNGDERLKTIWNKLPGGGTISKYDYGYYVTGEISDWTQQADSNAAMAYGFGYDGASELLSATRFDASSGAVQKQYSYGYDKADNRILDQVDAVIASSTYNNVNQLVGRAGSGLMVFEGTVSEPSTVTVGGNPATVDGNNHFRGTAMVSPGQQNVTIQATDTNGNVTTKTASLTATAGSLSKTLIYDLNGNLTSDGTRTFTWDAENRLVKYDQPLAADCLECHVPAGLPTGLTSEFLYDGLGRRSKITRKMGTDFIGSSQYVWDGVKMVAELSAASPYNLTKRFYHEGEAIYDGVGSMTPTNKVYYTFDHLGSVREILGADHSLLSRYEYDPYGQRSTVVESYISDFGYAGYYMSAASDLQGAPSLLLTLFRGYDPELGRWVSRDPILESGGVNLYSYVSNDPLDFQDPLGLFGIGFVGNASAMAGFGWGGSASTSVGGGVFIGRNPCNGNNGSLGVYNSNAYGYGAGTVGAVAGVGAGLFVTNAENAEQLSQTNNTITVDGGYFGAAVGVSVSWGNGIINVEMTKGKAVGPFEGAGFGVSWIKDGKMWGGKGRTPTFGKTICN